MTKSPRKNVPDVGIELGAACMPSELASDRATAPGRVKGKRSQKYTSILFKSICKTEHFEANCMETGYLLLKLLRFYVFKIAAKGYRRFEINMKVQNYEIYFSETYIHSYFWQL